MNVYFNEYNVLMDNAVYLPLVSGLLRSYAETKPAILERYRFMPFIFMRDTLERIVDRFENPAVAAFSISMWNANLSLAVAERLKKKFPECLIVFGGPHVPFDADDFLKTHPSIDVTVRGEGEVTFAEVLLRFLDTWDFAGIPGISYRDPKSGSSVKNPKERALVMELDLFPSPYLEGVFDDLLPMDIDFQAIVETNRGCPFLCSYCFWGQGGLNKQFRFYSLKRVRQVADWCGANKIQYVFCADSNYGMFKRDLEIAGYFTETKRACGYPEKFRVCYGKNAEDNIFETGKLLTRYGMEKGITLSRQSDNPEALANVGRKNVKLSAYNSLQKKYNRENIPVYTELILGLPGETYRSFLKGIEEILRSGLKNQLFVYFCQVYPNTELSDAGYRDKFKIRTKSVRLNEVHAAVRPEGQITEFEDIIIRTATMPLRDWKRSAVVAWVMQLFHGLKAAFYIMLYLNDRHGVNYTEFFEYVALNKMKSDKIKILKKEISKFYGVIDSILEGKTRSRVMPDFGLIYWEQEEAAFLDVSQDREAFYDEMLELCLEYLGNAGARYDVEELREVVRYQMARVPDYKPLKDHVYHFRYNIPEYFEGYFLEERGGISRKPQAMALVSARDFKGDKKAFARETIVYGRKNDRILRPVRWTGADAKNKEYQEVKP